MTPRSFFLSAGVAFAFLSIGFLAGRLTAPVRHTASTEAFSAALDPRNVALPTSQPPTQVASADSSPPADQPSTSTAQSRLDAAMWLHQHGLLHVVSFMEGGQLSPAFVKLFDLQPAEVNLLNRVFSDVRSKVETLTIANAQAELSPDGSRLIVQIPSLPVESRALYNEMLQAFDAALGPERSAQFQTLAGSHLDAAFGGFGLDPVTYEINLVSQSQMADGRPIYEVRRSHTSADGSGFARSESQLTEADLRRAFPLLSRFLPPDRLKQ